ncbi:MAG: hypothetical protein NTW95_00620 [Candidatus Aminicenantes bacterium]|nr:hypothetical protein [Candidatus Aminicenantes bacterium]
MKKTPAFIFAILAAINVSGQDVEIISKTNGCYSKNDIKFILEIAKNYSTQGIKKIIIASPEEEPNYPIYRGARVIFEPEIIGDYIIKRVVKIFNRKWLHGLFDKEKIKYKIDCWFTILDDRYHQFEVCRRFPIKDRILDIQINNEISYSKARSLLEAIEGKTYEMQEKYLDQLSINMELIRSISFNPKTDEYSFNTSESGISGNTYYFRQDENGRFILVRHEVWVT